MQDYNINAEDTVSVSEKDLKVEQLKQYMLFIFKRILVFVSFGPGVLGVLWLIGRILKR